MNNIESPPPEKEEGRPRQESANQSATEGTTANPDGTQVLSDGLPPIQSVEEFLSQKLNPPNIEGPICPCRDCGGELAEPCELEDHRKQHPDWQPQPACTCGDDTDVWHEVMEETRKEWDFSKQQDNLLTVYDWYRRYRCHRHKKSFPKHLKECQEMLGIGDDEFKRLIEEVEKKMAAGDAAEPETAEKANAATTKRKLKGCALADLVNKEINKEDTLLGNRYLCRGGGMIIVAPSGHGKSVLSTQVSIQWAVGDSSFGIKPARPLRTLIIQAEDDEGDCIEMAQIAKHLGLEDEELNLLNKNVWLEPLNDLTGQDFIKAVDEFLDEWPADMVLINPLTAYLGADDKDQKAATLFLRNWLNPVLTKHNCAAIIIHHTPKTNFASTDNYKPSDWMYRGAGAATITNWARAILVIDPGNNEGVYKFIAAKRGKRIGWTECNDDPRAIVFKPTLETYWAHSKGDKLLWIPATKEQIKAESKDQKEAEPKDLLPYIPEHNEKPVIMEVIQEAVNGKIGKNRVRGLIKLLEADGKIECVEEPRKGARPEKKYKKKLLFTP